MVGHSLTSLLSARLSSPSQGPCCTADCSYKGRNEKCREESECAHQGMCNGVSPQCPTSEPKANFTACHGETQVCLNGVRDGRPVAVVTRRSHQRVSVLTCPYAPPPQGCSGSICEKYGLEACTCASQDGKDETELCHVCCMEKSESFQRLHLARSPSGRKILESFVGL